MLAAVAVCLAAPTANAQTTTPAPASPTPAWRQIFENAQTIYYLSAANAPPTGEAEVETLQQFKVPQVFGGDQIWSIVSHYRLDCGQDRIVTLDNAYYPHRMGEGSPIQSLNPNDTWHAPEPGTLGELIWNTACGK